MTCYYVCLFLRASIKTSLMTRRQFFHPRKKYFHPRETVFYPRKIFFIPDINNFIPEKSFVSPKFLTYPKLFFSSHLKIKIKYVCHGEYEAHGVWWAHHKAKSGLANNNFDFCKPGLFLGLHMQTQSWSGCSLEI